MSLSFERASMTEAFTDELFALPETTTVRFSISRLLEDVKRLPDDTEEPMSKVGLGMIYTRTSHGKNPKPALQPRQIRDLASQYVEAHHQKWCFLVSWTGRFTHYLHTNKKRG